jgi:hypothetical protein
MKNWGDGKSMKIHVRKTLCIFFIFISTCETLKFYDLKVLFDIFMATFYIVIA